MTDPTMPQVAEGREGLNEIIAQRLTMQPKNPNGDAWLAAYKADVRRLLAQVEQLTKERADDLQLWAKRRAEQEKRCDTAERAAVQWMEKAEQAQAQVEALREELTRIADYAQQLNDTKAAYGYYGVIAMQASRAALSEQTKGAG
jgi:DNA repair exonuclease SbcCD ATPase subunit